MISAKLFQENVLFTVEKNVLAQQQQGKLSRKGKYNILMSIFYI